MAPTGVDAGGSAGAGVDVFVGPGVVVDVSEVVVEALLGLDVVVSDSVEDEVRVI
jgi:hypothetical protein